MMQHSVKIARRICPVFRYLVAPPELKGACVIQAPEPARLRVIGRIEPPAFDPSELPGFSVDQIRAGLTVPATTGSAG